MQNRADDHGTSAGEGRAAGGADSGGAGPQTPGGSGTQQPFRDPTQWKTGDEPATAAQRSYLETLATEAGESVDDLDSLTKAEAALRIEELQELTGRGQSRQK
jgi:hypothetical protein